MPPGPPRPSCPALPGAGPHRPRVLTHLPGARIPASARPLARAPRQAHVPPPRAPSLGREGGRARLPGKGESEGGSRGRSGAGRAGRDAEGRAGLRLLQPPLGSRAAGGGTRDPAGRRRARLGPRTNPGAPRPPEQQPRRQPPPPGRPEPQRRAAPRGRTRAAESGVPAPERRRGRRRALGGADLRSLRPAEGEPQGRRRSWRVGVVVPGDGGIKVCKIEGPSSQGLCRCSGGLLGVPSTPP